MRPWIARLLTHLYPRRWRERYGAEFEALLETDRGAISSAANVVWSAVREHLSPTQGGSMHQEPLTSFSILKRPSAFLPLAMSIIALMLVLTAVGLGGAQRETDEGAVAHIWQILMAGQMPIIAFFVVRWLPRAPRPTLVVLTQQAGAALASVAAVFFFNLG